MINLNNSDVTPASEANFPTKQKSRNIPSDWLHRWAIAVALAILLLIGVGGLVTTQDAGMAVPDWPGTYGYNMFAYPLAAWLYGPFDQLVEHGHRLLGSLVGILSIGLCLIAWLNEPRRWVRWFCLALLLGIIAQGMLGGFRVLFDARTFAMIHGISGPLVFGWATAIAVFTSRWWQQELIPAKASRSMRWLSLMLLVATVAQLVLGAQLRHVQPWTKPSTFMGMVHLHLTFAAIVSLLVVATAINSRSRKNRHLRGIGWPVIGLLGLLFIQLALGTGTWIANYALPWDNSIPELARYTIATKGYWESWIVTGHQTTGSLIISVALVLTLRIARLENEASVAKPPAE